MVTRPIRQIASIATNSIYRKTESTSSSKMIINHSLSVYLSLFFGFEKAPFQCTSYQKAIKIDKCKLMRVGESIAIKMCTMFSFIRVHESLTVSGSLDRITKTVVNSVSSRDEILSCESNVVAKHSNHPNAFQYRFCTDSDRTSEVLFSLKRLLLNTDLSNDPVEVILTHMSEILMRPEWQGKPSKLIFKMLSVIKEKFLRKINQCTQARRSDCFPLSFH